MQLGAHSKGYTSSKRSATLARRHPGTGMHDTAAHFHFSEWPSTMQEDQLPSANTDSRSVKIERLVELIGPKRDALARILNRFIDAESVLRSGVEALVVSTDVDEFCVLGHRFKSSARTIGADALADACVELEGRGKSGDVSACREQTAVVLDLYARAVLEIKAYLAQPD